MLGWQIVAIAVVEMAYALFGDTATTLGSSRPTFFFVAGAGAVTAMLLTEVSGSLLSPMLGLCE